MATNTSITNLDPVLKTLYKGSVIDTCYKRFPLFAIMPKSEGFVGRDMPIPIKYSSGGGRSSVFATAQANYFEPKYDDFMITRVNDYAVGGIDGEAIEASAADKGSFVRGLKATLDSKMLECVRSMEIAMFRDGTGAIAQLHLTASGVAGTGAILRYPAEAANFEVGDYVKASDTHVLEHKGNFAGSATYRAEIQGIDRASGTLTSSGNWTALITAGVGAIAHGDWLFIDGDRRQATIVDYVVGTTGRNKICGLEQWVPAAAPTAGTNFFGVDRSVDSRLGGLRLDASGYSSVEEAIIDAVGICNQEGGKVDCFVLNPAYFRRLVKELGSKVEYDKLVAQGPKGAIAHIGFRSVVLDGEAGPVKVLSDRHCPYPAGWALDMSTLKLHTLGPAPKILMHDGNRILRQATDDGYEFRCGYRGQMVCDAPGWNCYVTMPA